MNRLSRQTGFTLVELLIVVLVISILVSIVIPSFGNAKTKSFDGAAKADIRNMIVAEENYYTAFQAYINTSVASGTQADLDGDGTEDFRASSGVSLAVTAYTNGFQITSKHRSSPNTWCVNSSQAAAAAGAIVRGTSC